jgi:hypothetical protein
MDGFIKLWICIGISTIVALVMTTTIIPGTDIHPDGDYIFRVGDNLGFDYHYNGDVLHIATTLYEFKGINTFGGIYFEHIKSGFFTSATETAIFNSDIVSFSDTPWDFVVVEKTNGQIIGYFRLKEGHAQSDVYLIGHKFFECSFFITTLILEGILFFGILLFSLLEHFACKVGRR